MKAVLLRRRNVNVGHDFSQLPLSFSCDDNEEKLSTDDVQESLRRRIYLSADVIGVH